MPAGLRWIPSPSWKGAAGAVCNIERSQRTAQIYRHFLREQRREQPEQLRVQINSRNVLQSCRNIRKLIQITVRVTEDQV